MKLRYAADVRTLLWVAMMFIFALTPYFNPAMSWWLWPVSCYFALAAGVIAHNHNHTPTFTSRGVNQAFGIILSLFYGYPTFAWVPTHNLNHHRYVNRAGDATITWRYNKNHTWPVAFTYFFVSSYWQSEPIQDYIKKARASNPKLFRQIVTQYAIWIGFHATMITVAVSLYGGWVGLRIWLLAFGIPAFFALWTIMFFNYIQHIHADPWSKTNHSRSWTSPLLNFMLFNNGLHAAHHEAGGAHWTKLPEIQARLTPHIDPRLVHYSFWAFCFRQYIVAPFIPSVGTQQVGRAAYDPPSDAPPSFATTITGEVEATEAGVNSAII